MSGTSEKISGINNKKNLSSSPLSGSKHRTQAVEEKASVFVTAMRSVSKQCSSLSNVPSHKD
jgi:hypothetical protein